MANYKIGVEFEADGSKAVSAINQVAQAMQNLQNQVGTSNQRMQSSFQQLSVSFGSIFKVLGTTFAVNNIAGFIKDTVDATAQLQQTKISFEVFTGSAETAKNMLAQLKDIAIKSPMQFQDITKGTQTLLGYGLTAQQVVPIVKMLGDVSGGNSDKFNRLALAFGQVNAAGRLMGQETRQMINAGFNPLQAISDKTGKSMAQLSQDMRDGKISVQDVADAFTYATSEGGRFYGMAEKQSQTLGGALNKLSESFFFIKSDIGDFITKTFDLQGGIQGLVNYFTNLVQPIKDVIQTFAMSSNVMAILNFAMDTLKGGFVIAIKTFESLLSIIDSIFGGIKTVIQWIFDKIPGLGTMFKGLFNDTIGKVAKLGQEYSKAKKTTETTKPEENKPLGFSTTPTGVGTDKISKAEANKIAKLQELAKNGYTKLSEMYRAYTMSKTDIMEQDAEKELLEYKKYGIDTTNIVENQFIQKQRVAKEETRKLSALVNKGFNTEGLKKSLKSMVDNVKDGFSELRNLMDVSINNKFALSLDEWAERFASSSAKFTLAINSLVISDNVNKIKTFASAMYASLKDFSVGVFTGFGEIIGSLTSGINNFGDAVAQVGNMFLNLFGDLLIKMGTSAIEMGITAEAIQKALSVIGLPGGGAGAIIAGTLAVAAGYALKGIATKSQNAISNNIATKSQTTNTKSSGMTSGSSYQYGGSSYATQTVRLSIDLTGAITASPTGYNINKSLETVLRVTGR